MGGIKKPLTFEDRQFIEKAKNILSVINIAKKIGRSYSIISKELRDNGGRKNYCAEEAQKNAEKRSAPYRRDPEKEQFIIENLHLSREKLAKITGLHPVTVYKILRINKKKIEKFNSSQLKFSFKNGGENGEN